MKRNVFMCIEAVIDSNNDDDDDLVYQKYLRLTSFHVRYSEIGY